MTDKTKPKKFFFWADGIAETVFPTSLESAALNTIDRLTASADLGFYEPIIAPGTDKPQTDIVIPYMFSVEPWQFNGRAALELVDTGYIPPAGNWVGSIRLAEATSGNDLNWRNHPPLSFNTIQTILESIRRETQGYPLRLIASPFASHQNMLILSSENRLVIEELIAKTQFVAETLGMTFVDEAIIKFRKLPLSPHKIFFAGWSHGSLRGSFRLIGAQVNENRPALFDYLAYQNDLSRLVTNILPSVLNKYDFFVFFLKETDTASHNNSRSKKIKALEFFDHIVEKVVEVMPNDALIIVLGDHPTNLGAPSASCGPTPYLIARKSNLHAEPHIHFCEKTLRMCASNMPVLSMYDLRRRIYEAE